MIVGTSRHTKGIHIMNIHLRILSFLLMSGAGHQPRPAVTKRRLDKLECYVMVRSSVQLLRIGGNDL